MIIHQLRGTHLSLFISDLSVSNSLDKVHSFVTISTSFVSSLALRVLHAQVEVVAYLRTVVLLFNAKIAGIKGFSYRQTFSITVNNGKLPILRNNCQISRLPINSLAITCPAPHFPLLYFRFSQSTRSLPKVN